MTPLFPTGFSDLLDDPAALQELEDLLLEMTEANEDACACTCGGSDEPLSLLGRDFQADCEQEVPPGMCLRCLAAAGSSQAAAFDMATLMGRVAAEVIARDVKIVVTSNLPPGFGIGQPPAAVLEPAAAAKAMVAAVPTTVTVTVQRAASRTSQTPQPECATQLAPLPAAIEGVGDTECVSAAAVRTETKQLEGCASPLPLPSVVSGQASATPPPPAQAAPSPKPHRPGQQQSPSHAAGASSSSSSSSSSLSVRVMLPRSGSSSAFSALQEAAVRSGGEAALAGGSGSGSGGGVMIVPALSRSPTARVLQPHVGPLDAALAIVASTPGSSGLPAQALAAAPASGTPGPRPQLSALATGSPALAEPAPRSTGASPAASLAAADASTPATQQVAVRPNPSLPPRPQAVQVSVLPPSRQLAVASLGTAAGGSGSTVSLAPSIVSTVASVAASQMLGGAGGSGSGTPVPGSTIISGAGSVSGAASVASGLAAGASDKDRELRDKRAAERAAAAQAKQAAARAEAERLKREKAQKPKLLSPLLVEARRTAAEREVRRQEQREARRLKALEKERANEARERALMAAEEWHMERVKWAKNIGGREGGWRTVRVFISSTFSDMHGAS